MDGDAAGGGEREAEETRRRELGSLVEAIKSSEVLENRTSLINQLEDPFQLCAEDLGLALESLLASWDDSACSGVSHCMLHKSILQVALKCSYLDATKCLGPFITLGAKAGSWCVKHLLWSVESIDESEDAQEEEHSRLFPEIIALTLNISSKLLPVASKCIANNMVHAVGDFILELLTLTEKSILDNKKLGTTGHVAKTAPVFLDETIKLCRGYSEAAKSDQCIISMPKEETTVEHKEPDLSSNVTRIIACTIQSLCKIGTYAASSGGSQVILLNISWKGIVSLLQLGKGMIEEKVNVREIILIPISIAIESLRVATETWCVPLQEDLGTAEARRAFLPIKYFLMNAVRICSIYPSEAMTIYKNIIRCALVISYSSILFCRNPQLKAASELLFELLEPSSVLLLDTLMKSPEVSPESKCQLVRFFLEKGETNNPEHMGQVDHIMSFASLGSIFSVDSYDDNINRALLPAEFAVFLHFLNAYPWLREEVVIELCKKLYLLLNILMLEDVYSYVLGCQIPALSGDGDSPKVIWQPVYTSLIQALKTFMIAAAASSAAWSEFEVFLLESLFHPHFLCMEILTELWCFFVHYAETETSTYLINQLFILLKTLASPDEVFAPFSALRKLARASCTILSYAPSATIDQIYTSVLNENSSKSPILYLALLMEGFPFESLSFGIKEHAVKTLFTSFTGYLQNQNYKNHGEIDLPTSSSSSVIGLPVHALASAFQSCEIEDAITIDKKSVATMFRIAISLINLYRTSPDSSKNLLVQHISSILVIVTHMRHLCAFSELEKLTLELHTLFMSGSGNSNAVLSQCKPSMASFMAILGHLNTTEDDASVLCSAMWDLFHFLLRERHWALIHLAMGSFGYFAARTSFAQLWKFVPVDAALSYTSTGVDIDEDGFMSELKAFLQKEVALRDNKWSEEQICLLVSEGRMLKKLVESCLEIPLVSEPEKVSVTNDVKTKKRKRPDGICEGMMLVQSGLKIMRSALSETDLGELKDRFAVHLSRLEDAVSQITSFSDKI